jgi:oligopeptide/dipeptide ABC transporter ATP-binding protein
MVEVIRAHTDHSKAEARDLARESLTDVDLNPNRITDYPHELSGGQRQRVVIALSLALRPSIIIADVPTTGLDVVVQDSILDLIQRIQDERDISMLIITHDMSVVAEVTDRTGVMYGGHLVEIGDTADIFDQTTHPYTIGLSNAFPSLDQDIEELVHIPGSLPDLRDPQSGCRFAGRCPFRTEECLEEPPLMTVNGNHEAKCHYVDSADEFRELGKRSETWELEEVTDE